MEVSKLLLHYQEGQRDFRQVSLRNVNLAQVQRAFINLGQADLWGINLWEAQLVGANLVQVDLSSAEQTARQLRTNSEPPQPAVQTLWRSALRNFLGRNKSAETDPEFPATPAPVNPAAASTNSAPSNPNSAAQAPVAQAPVASKPVASHEDMPTGWPQPPQPPSLRPEQCEPGYEPSYESGYPSGDVQGGGEPGEGEPGEGEPGDEPGYEPSSAPGYPDPSSVANFAGTPIAPEPSRLVVNPWEVEPDSDEDDNAVFLTPLPAIPSEADWSILPEPRAAEAAIPWAAELSQAIDAPAIVVAPAWEADLSAAASSAVTNASGSDLDDPSLTPSSIAPDLAFVTDPASPAWDSPEATKPNLGGPNAPTHIEAEVSMGFLSFFGDVLLEEEERQEVTIEAGARGVAIEPSLEEEEIKAAIEATPQVTTLEDPIHLEMWPESEARSTVATLASFPGAEEIPTIVKAPKPLATEEAATEEAAADADLASAADPVAADASAPAKLPLPLIVALVAIAAIVATLSGLAALGILSFDRLGQSSPTDPNPRGTTAATPSASPNPDPIAPEPEPSAPSSQDATAAEAANLKAVLGDGTILLQPAATEAFWKMQGAARQAGIHLYPLQGYLTPEAETAYWQRQEAALATTDLETLTSLSNYRNGYGIDIGDYDQADRDQASSFRETQAFAWLAENAEDYGFVPWTAAVALDSVDRPWHWHYNPDLVAPSE